MRRILEALICCALALSSACSDAGEPAPETGPAAGPAAAPGPIQPARLAGRLVVTGVPAGALRGSVQLALWSAADLGRAGALPLLMRNYELDDPDWSRAGSVRARYFGLDDAHRVGAASRELPQGLVLEARLVTEGDPSAASGPFSATLGVRNGETDLQLVLSTETATAQPVPPRKPGGG